MPLSFQVTGAAKNNLVVSLAAILLSDSNLDISQENIDSVVTASGNTIPSYYSALYANYIEKAGGVERFFAGPSAGGGSAGPSSAAPSGGAAPAAAAAPVKEEKPKEEVVDALDGGMDMFGGGGGGGGDY